MPRQRGFSHSGTLIAFLALAVTGVFGLGLTTIATQTSASTDNGTVALTAVDAAKGSPGQRLLSWSGITWLVYPNCSICGPQQTPTTNAKNAVYVDSRGWLHMKVSRIAGKWRGVELRALTNVPYGTYRWVVNSKTADMDPWAVLGMFVYRPGTAARTNEIDIEDSRFPHLLRAPNNAQFTVQPYNLAGNQHGYYISPDYHPLVQQFTWSPAFGAETQGSVHFEFARRYACPVGAAVELRLCGLRRTVLGEHATVRRALDEQEQGTHDGDTLGRRPQPEHLAARRLMTRGGEPKNPGSRS